MIRLLIDTDAFCKLGLAGLLEDAAGELGATLTACARLPALPYMLRRGTLRRHYGATACDRLLPLADKMPRIRPAGEEWEKELAAVQEIDAGEAQLFATGAVSRNINILTGDKRAFKAVSRFEEIAAALSGRIAILEAVLLALCDRMGPDELRRHLAPLMDRDRTVEVCFSSDNPGPRGALRAYVEECARDSNPLVLWSPNLGKTP